MNNTIAMRRFEIVIGIEQLEELMELLERSGVRGYTVIKNLGGSYMILPHNEQNMTLR